MAGIGMRKRHSNSLQKKVSRPLINNGSIFNESFAHRLAWMINNDWEEGDIVRWWQLALEFKKNMEQCIKEGREDEKVLWNPEWMMTLEECRRLHGWFFDSWLQRDYLKPKDGGWSKPTQCEDN
jgi:hypothetical protein